MLMCHDATVKGHYTPFYTLAHNLQSIKIQRTVQKCHKTNFRMFAGVFVVRFATAKIENKIQTKKTHSKTEMNKMYADNLYVYFFFCIGLSTPTIYCFEFISQKLFFSFSFHFVFLFSHFLTWAAVIFFP